MPVSPTYPGVYVQEVPSGVRAITGVSTSIAMFVGMTARGVLNKPTRMLSFAEYQRTFGDNTEVSEVTEQVRQFFQNGGGEAIVMRVADGAKVAKVTLCAIPSSHLALDLQAKEAGKDGDNLRVEIDYNTPSPESTFNLHVFREVVTPSGEYQTENRETHPNLSMDPSVPRFIEKIVNQESSLIKVKRNSNIVPISETTPAPFAPGQGYSMGGLLIDWSDAPAAATAINELLKQGKHLQLSVDGKPPVPVTLDNLDSSAASASVNNWITTWQGNLGTGVTVDTIEFDDENGDPSEVHLLRISSNTTVGGRVEILPASSNDAARKFQLGVGQGGIEVSGYARQRPAPTGYFSRIGVETSLDRLTKFAGIAQSELKRCFITDTSGGDHSGHADVNAIKVSFAGPDPSSLFYHGTRFKAADLLGGTAGVPLAGSLRNVQENLELLAKAINDGTKNTWSAAVNGHGIVLTANYGGPNSDTNAELESDNLTSGAYDDSSGYQIGENTNIFDDAFNSANVRSYSLGVDGPGAFTDNGVAGVDGTRPKLEDYRKAFIIIDREVNIFNLFILPRNMDQNDTHREEVWGPASSFCQKRRAFLLMDPRKSWKTYNEVADDILKLRIGLVKDHSAIYWPRVKISSNGTQKEIDPSGSIAGLMARIDSTRGVWKAPAGIEADLRAVRGLEYAITDDENGVINKKAVNAIRVFPNGIVCWGARTMDGFDNSGNTDYKYTPVRRFALYMEESLYRGLKWVVFEPNAEPLWSQIRLNVGAFMHSLFRQSAFKGETSRDAYFVKCDIETTTQNDINQGIVNIWVGFAPLKPAEFVILHLQQMAGQIET